MLYTEEMARANIRNRDGRRVLILGREDRLTPGARDYLARERIALLSPEEARIGEYRLLSGGVLREKPEHMTHLHSDVLVLKTHPRIRFRGKMDTLQAELLQAQRRCPEIKGALGELLALARQLIRCEVMAEPVPEEKLGGLTPPELRERSHNPRDYYGQGHFMPEAADGDTVLTLNRCRCALREAELAAAEAFTDSEGCCTRGDILRALNRMSSYAYILMIREKAGKTGSGREQNGVQ